MLRKSHISVNIYIMSFKKFLCDFTELLRILMHKFFTSEAYPYLFIFAVWNSEFSSYLAAYDSASSNQDRLCILNLFREFIYFFRSIFDAHWVLAFYRRCIAEASAKDKVVENHHLGGTVKKLHVDRVVRIYCLELSLLKSHLVMKVNT